MTGNELLLRYNAGERDFRYADLWGANLAGADLEGANLWGAKLAGAYLGGANLEQADLRGADLRGAYLRHAYLRHADLEGADLRGAYLRGAYLRGANLWGAKLWDAYLRYADLRYANLTDTCLDPMAVGNVNTSGYEIHTTRAGHMWCKGYRTRHSPYYSNGSDYDDGAWYEAPVFCTSPNACRPGLHVCRHPDDDFLAKYPSDDIIAVWFRDVDLHRTEGKDRVRAFWVEGDAE